MSALFRPQQSGKWILIELFLTFAPAAICWILQLETIAYLIGVIGASFAVGHSISVQVSSGGYSDGSSTSHRVSSPCYYWFFLITQIMSLLGLFAIGYLLIQRAF